MKKCIFISLFLIGFTCVWADNCCPSEKSKSDQIPAKKECQEQDSAEIRKILSKMNTATENLKTCQASIKYLLIQDPDLLNTKILQNGMLYYKKDIDRSKLRIHFVDIKQDDFETEKQREEYLFDGVWLTHINYKLEQIDLYQQAPENKPMDVFELISHNFPLIGFSGTENIEKEFDVSLDKISKDPNALACLVLDVKKDSKFNESYTKIDFWIDNKSHLPLKVIAVAPQGDESHIEFLYEKVNKKLKNAVFTIETPAHFRKNIEQLKTNEQMKTKP